MIYNNIVAIVMCNFQLLLNYQLHIALTDIRHAITTEKIYQFEFVSIGLNSDFSLIALKRTQSIECPKIETKKQRKEAEKAI